MNSKILSLIRNELGKIIKDNEVLDVILFGSSIKGKAIPRDKDIAVIIEKPKTFQISGYHISVLSPSDFFHNPPQIVNTLLREGYSIKHRKFLAERFNFLNKVLFTYDMTSLKASEKVKIVTTLRGIKNIGGMVKEYEGEWVANQVFIVPTEIEHIFREFFINFNVKFKERYVLID